MLLTLQQLLLNVSSSRNANAVKIDKYRVQALSSAHCVNILLINKIGCYKCGPGDSSVAWNTGSFAKDPV